MICFKIPVTFSWINLTVLTERVEKPCTFT
jgi:hypothetical protein